MEGRNNMEENKKSENLQKKINQLAKKIENRLSPYLYRNGAVIFGNVGQVIKEVNRYGESDINKSQDDKEWQENIKAKVKTIVHNLEQNYENDDFVILPFETMYGFFKPLNSQETFKELQEIEKQILCVNKDLKRLNFIFTEVAKVEFETNMEIFKDKIVTDINEQIIKMIEENKISIGEFKKIVNENDYISSTKELIEYIRLQNDLDLSDLKEKINNFKVVTNNKSYENELKERIGDFINVIEENSLQVDKEQIKEGLITEIKDVAIDYYIDVQDEDNKRIRNDTEDNCEETITSVTNLDNERHFTVARVMQDGKCVELHYDQGEASLEYGIRVADDLWEDELDEDVEWFNLDLTDDEILEHLNKEYDQRFLVKIEEFDKINENEDELEE